MSNKIQVIQDKLGNNVFPITHEKAVRDSAGVSLEAKLSALESKTYIEAWDGASTPVVANIPAGVVVSYNGTNYTGTLAASSSTDGKIYLVKDGTEYDRYASTINLGGTYIWSYLGTTAMSLTGYATEEELNQLDGELNGLYNGTLIDAEEVQLSMTWTEGQIIGRNGSIQSFEQGKITSPIDISQYAGETLKAFGMAYNWAYPAYAILDNNSERIVLSAYQSKFTGDDEIAIPNNAKYIIFSTKIGFDYSSVTFYLPYTFQYGVKEILDLKLSIPKKSEWLLGNSFSGDASTKINGSLLLPLEWYKRVKIATSENSISFTVLARDRFYDHWVVKFDDTVTLTAAQDGYKYADLDIDLRGYESAMLYLPTSKVKQTSPSTQFPGIPVFITPTKADLIGTDTIIDPTQYHGIFRLSIDFLYEKTAIDSDSPVQQESDMMVLSDFFMGKEYVAYGDSIGVTPDETHCYPWLLRKYFKGMILKNCCSSGSAPIATTGVIAHPNLTDANLANVTANTMLVSISGGHNYWVTSENINSTDRSTPIGAINYAIDFIRSVSPRCIIVLCPTYVSPSTPDGERGERGKMLEDYQRIATNKHVGLAPTADLCHISWTDDSAHQLRSDGAHPTEYGAARFAGVLKEYIKQMGIY